MSQEQIIIEIAEDGSTTVAVEGHAGAGCKELTAQIEKALGTTTGDRKTHEYHQRAAQAQKAKQ